MKPRKSLLLPTKLVLILIGTLIVAVGCQTTTTPTFGTECSTFKPISYSRLDTAETRKQVEAHNAVYKAICTGKR